MDGERPIQRVRWSHIDPAHAVEGIPDISYPLGSGALLRYSNASSGRRRGVLGSKPGIGAE